MLRSQHSFTRIIQHLERIIFYNKNFDLRDTIILTGSPRSGTSWLMKILRVIPGYTDLFEPLNPIYFPESFEVGFQSRTYLPSSKDWQKGEKYLRKIFTSLPIYDSSSLKENDKRKKFIILRYGFFHQLSPEILMHQLVGNKLIVKFVRLNRLLPWVAERFQLRSMIFIIRHPCAVIDSQLKTGFFGYHPTFPPYQDIYPNRKTILDEASKIRGLENSLLNRLKKIKTREEIIAASWCLDNFVPLSYLKPYPWTVVVYEKLIREGEKEIDRIFHEIGEKNVRRSAYRYLKIPSMLIQKGEYEIVTKPDVQLSKWKKSLSEKQIKRILSIVSAFGLDFYSENLEPDYNNIYVENI